jgi:protein SCO1
MHMMSCRCWNSSRKQAHAVIIRSTLLTFVALLPFALRAQKGNMHQHHMAPAASSEDQPGNQPVAVAGLTIPDVWLVDQHGKRVRFYSDLIRGKVVAINTIFTTCTTICPLMRANFARLSKTLASGDADQDKKINLISISIDPVVDTPERLMHWSTETGQTGSDWTLLTGKKEDVDRLLKALQVFTPDKLSHAPVVLIGGDGTGDWARASALLPPSRLADLIHARIDRQPGRAISKL